MRTTKIVLVDGNNFFASCEQMINPSLKGKPVCVLSNNDGCIIARSQEAKKLGITMGMPFFMAKRSFPNAVYLSSNFSLYHEISQRMMKLLQKYSPKIDVYSIDEAFLDVSGMDRVFNVSYQELIAMIKEDIENHIGISVSVGMASSKILAKLANHKAKKGCGVYFIDDDLIHCELENIPLEEIWGIGRNVAKTLMRYGVFYADEILLKDDDFYKKVFGKKGLELKYELSGQSVLPVTGVEEKPKSIQKTRAFPEFSKDRDYIKTELLMHLNSVCRKLRSYNLKAIHISVMLRTKDFRVVCKEEKLETATNSEIVLINKVYKLFDEIFQQGIVYRSSGVLAYSLQEAQRVQLSLFEQDDKEERVSSAIDKIENKFGKGAISVGSWGIKSVVQKHTRKKRMETVLFI